MNWWQIGLSIGMMIIGPAGIGAVFLLKANRRKINAEAMVGEASASTARVGNPVDIATSALARVEFEAKHSAHLRDELEEERHAHSRTLRQRRQLYNILDSLERYLNRRDAECESYGHPFLSRPVPFLNYLREQEQAQDDKRTENMK